MNTTIPALFTAPVSQMPAPTLTAKMMKAVLRFDAGVLVQDPTGRVYPLPWLTDEQADDSDVTVLVTGEEAAGYLQEAGGNHARAAEDATLDLFVQHARGLL